MCQDYFIIQSKEIKMLKRTIYRNCTIWIPAEVIFVESWDLDFHFFAIRLRTYWIYEDGRVIRHKNTYLTK